MTFFKPWVRKESDKDARHIFKPVWLRDSPTQDETTLHSQRQLRLLSVYGIGGCSVIELSDQQMKSWYDFAMGGPKGAGIEALLAVAIPKAYKAVILERKDCTGYFATEHNERVRATKTTESQIRLCLAREGELLDVLDRAKAGRLLMTNTRLLKSSIGKSLSRVGLIGFGGQVEHTFLDFVPDASVGDNVVVHRNIACETFEDDGGASLF
jgi:hypothetical protein